MKVSPTARRSQLPPARLGPSSRCLANTPSQSLLQHTLLHVERGVQQKGRSRRRLGAGLDQRHAAHRWFREVRCNNPCTRSPTRTSRGTEAALALCAASPSALSASTAPHALPSYLPCSACPVLHFDCAYGALLCGVSPVCRLHRIPCRLRPFLGKPSPALPSLP